MADSPTSSVLSDPPSAVESDGEDNISINIPSSRPSIDINHADIEHLAPPPSKRRKTAPTGLSSFERALSSQPADDDDNISLSSDGWSSGPGDKDDDEHSLRDQAQMECLWRDCDFGIALNNDDLLRHVQTTHCITGGPKKTKYVCEWGECQRKTSTHTSGYALKAHMRSHTKEKPYYCALPECDKAFTRSDALAKHMRTVHEPEFIKGNEATPPNKKSIKLKLTNGAASSKSAAALSSTGQTHDEDSLEYDPSPVNDNIVYKPARHPVTGQPGFMIHYPPDIHFSTRESSINARVLMRELRRQLHWAEQENESLKNNIRMLERIRREEWTKKEILLEGVLEHELAAAESEGRLRNVKSNVLRAMQQDVDPSRVLPWTNAKQPDWRVNRADHDTEMLTPPSRANSQGTPSPPPTGASGGFDGEDSPYDNWLTMQVAQYEAHDRLRERKGNEDTVIEEDSGQSPNAAEADAVGVLLGMSHENS